MRNELLKALKAHFHGEIQRHKMNVEIFLNNPVGTGDHPDVMATLDGEVGKIAENEDKLMVLEQYFSDNAPKI